jgi:type III secretion apparatus needle protein
MEVSLDKIYEIMSKAVQASEDNLGKEVAKIDAKPKQDVSQQDLLNLQVAMQKWTTITNLSTNMLATIKDATKNVVGNMR